MINTNKLVQTTTLLHKQQVAKGTDVDRLQLQLDQIANQRKTVFSQQQQVLNALKFLMGKPISDTIQVSINENTRIQLDIQIQATTDMKLIDKKLQFNYAELKGLRNSKLPSLGAYGSMVQMAMAILAIIAFSIFIQSVMLALNCRSHCLMARLQNTRLYRKRLKLKKRISKKNW